MSVMEQQKLIFEELRKLNPEIIDDGVSDEMQYLSAPHRIMYVLKEVNGGSGWSLCEHMLNGGRNQEHDPTWDNIARWSEGILNLPLELSWSQLEKDCQSRRKKVLPKICAINVKKTSGGCTSNERAVYTAALNNADILNEQLKLYAPDLVICCGTEGSFVDSCFQGRKINWKMTTRGVWYFQENNITVISFSHPAARVKDCYLYYALLDAVREILENEVK